MNAAPQAQSERRVLIVRDGRPSDDLRPGFARQGLIATSSRSFKEARQKLVAERFDVLVTDVRLGAFNGLHLAIVAHYERPEMQVILLSDVDDPVLRQEASKVGARYIVTPAQPKAVRRSAGGTRREPARAMRSRRKHVQGMMANQFH